MEAPMVSVFPCLIFTTTTNFPVGDDAQRLLPHFISFSLHTHTERGATPFLSPSFHTLNERETEVLLCVCVRRRVFMCRAMRIESLSVRFDFCLLEEEEGGGV